MLVVFNLRAHANSIQRCAANMYEVLDGHVHLRGRAAREYTVQQLVFADAT